MAASITDKYKTLRKLESTKQSLSSNYDEINKSVLENKLYKQLRELAVEMVDSVQYLINHRGYYKDAGWQEVNDFMLIIDNYGVRWNKHQRGNLINYVIKLVDKLVK